MSVATADIDPCADARAVIAELDAHDARRHELCRRRDEHIASALAAGLRPGQVVRALDGRVSDTHVRGVQARALRPDSATL